MFTLQWHLTQECDLHCRHCYDRTSRNAFPFERALTLLDELHDFCRSRFVRGQVSLSGAIPCCTRGFSNCTVPLPSAT